MMKPISLLLTNERGDELGRMRLATLQVAEQGEQTTRNRRADLAAQMTQLYERLHLALAQEGLEADGDPLDVQISVSRALLSAPPAGEELLIPLPVRTVPAPKSSGRATASPAARSVPDPDPEEWDDLFDLDFGADAPGKGAATSGKDADTRGKTGKTKAAGRGGPGADDLGVRPILPPEDPGLDDFDFDLEG